MAHCFNLINYFKIGVKEKNRYVEMKHALGYIKKSFFKNIQQNADSTILNCYIFRKCLLPNFICTIILSYLFIIK